MTSLKEERLKAGLSQGKLAVASGVRANMIQKYEIGYRSIDGASLDTLCKLAIACGCTIPDILESEELKLLVKKAMEINPNYELSEDIPPCEDMN